MVLGRRADLALKAGSGHVIDVRHVCPAPPPPDARRAPVVLAETRPLPLSFVPVDRMRFEALHSYIDGATGTWKRWIGPCAAA